MSKTQEKPGKLQTMDEPTGAVAVAPMDEGTAMLQMIERVAMDPNANVEKMEKLLDMRLRVMSIAAEQAFNVAMTAAQSEMKPVSTDASNKQTKSKYASYAALDNALRPIYTKHGFSVSFNSGEGAPEGMVRILLYVGHVGGFTRTYQTDMPADGKGAKGGDVMTKTHATGAAFAYGQRYLLKLAFNVAIGEADTDGNKPDAPITPEQAQELDALADEVGTNPSGVSYKEQVCKYMKVGAIPEILASKFDEAKDMLESKRKC